jgi:hypothetical protein
MLSPYRCRYSTIGFGIKRSARGITFDDRTIYFPLPVAPHQTNHLPQIALYSPCLTHQNPPLCTASELSTVKCLDVDGLSDKLQFYYNHR